MKIILIIILVVAILVYYIIKPPPISLNQIQERYYDTTYNSDGMPNGGFLITMLSNQTVCPNYEGKSDKCIHDIKECGELLDISDINNLLNILHTNGTATSCYALDTTYFRTDLPNYVFGPYPGLDMTIGLILDLPKLWEYIACMFSIDSGSIARYNTCDTNNDCAPTIIPEWIGKGQKGWNDYLKTNPSRDLAMAGCGKINPRGLQESAHNFFINTDSDAQLNNKNIIFNVTQDYLFNNWVFSMYNRPYSKYQWKYWIEATQYLYSKTNLKSFTDLQAKNDDGYRENEVDIIIPNKPRKDSDKCDISDKFREIWSECIIGVFSNAKTNCSNTNLVKNSYFGCNDSKCCCSPEFSEKLAKSLVDKFNTKLPPGKKPIKAYTIDTLNIMNFNWKYGQKSDLDIKEL